MDEKQRAATMELIEATVRADSPDSLEIGTPAKGGAIKIYGNYSRPEEFREKIDRAIEVRSYAQKLVSGGEVV
jgi:hypothetical protein